MGLTMLGAASLVIFKGAGFDFPTHFHSCLDLPPFYAHGIIRHPNRLTAQLLPPAVGRVAARFRFKQTDLTTRQNLLKKR